MKVSAQVQLTVVVDLEDRWNDTSQVKWIHEQAGEMACRQLQLAIKGSDHVSAKVVGTPKVTTVLVDTP